MVSHLLRRLHRTWKEYVQTSRWLRHLRNRWVYLELEVLEDRWVPSVTFHQTLLPAPDALLVPALRQDAPTNGKILFTRLVNTAFGPNAEIFAMNPDGNSQTNLTNNPGNDLWGAWSPDGSKIAFTSDRDGNFEIYVMNADGSNQTRLTHDPGYDYQPAWSPDGTQIAFTRVVGGHAEIFVMCANGTNLRQLTDNAATPTSSANNLEPAWSPDGCRIAFTSDRDGNFEIYVMNADGSGQMNITRSPFADTEADWSPNGRCIAFSSDRDGNGEVYVMNADGTGVTRLTFDPTTDMGAAWSPDGTKIVFTALRNGQPEIYVMNADGSCQTRLTDNPTPDFQPDWQPLGLPQSPALPPTPPAPFVPPGVPPVVAVFSSAGIEEQGVLVFAVGLFDPALFAQGILRPITPDQLTQTVTVSFLTSPVNPALTNISPATPLTDYVPRSGLLIFEPGQPTTRVITVPLVADKAPEPNEIFATVLFLPTFSQLPTAVASTTLPGNLSFGKITNKLLASQPAAEITEFEFPPRPDGSGRPGGHPGGLVLGPDDNFWMTNQFDASIERFDPNTLAATEFLLPPGTFPHYITRGPDPNTGLGNDWVWFTALNGAIGVFNPLDFKSTLALFGGITANAVPHFLLNGGDGYLYFSLQDEEPLPEPGSPKPREGMGRIARINVLTKQIEEFPEALPTDGPFGNLRVGNRIHGLVIDAEGNLWAGLEEDDLLARFNRKTLTFDKFVDVSGGGGAHRGPHDLLLGPDNLIYIVQQDANLIGRFNPVTGEYREFTVPGLTPGDGPSLVEITIGPDNKSIWCSEFLNDRVVRLDLTTEEVTEFERGITVNAAPIGIAVGPDGNIWFAEATLDLTRSGRIARLVTGEPVPHFAFDFGTAMSPVQPGDTQVTEATRYNAVLGYGWLHGVISSRDRGTGSDLTRDFNRTRNGTFVVDVPDGTYVVTVTMGDALRRHERMGVFLEGARVDLVNTARGQFATRTYKVTVSDGQLTLRLADRGGPSPWVVINGLQIERVPLPFRFDFSTATSPVATGYTQVTEATGYSAGQGYGWRSGAIESRDRGPGSDGQNRNALVRDLNRTTDGTFAVDLANGTYTVTVTMGDGWHDMDLVGVFLEGVQVDTVSTLDDEFAVRTYTVRVTDGQLSLRLKDLGGTNPNADINALVIR